MAAKNGENKKPRMLSNPKYTLPSPRVSFENNLEIIKAYVVASKYGKEAIAYNKLKNLVNTYPTNISGNNEFLDYIGFIKEVTGQRGRYLPTERAIRLYNALKWNKEEDIKALLREALITTWFWDSTKKLLDFKGAADRKGLIASLGSDSEADPEKHNSSLNVLIDYLLRAGLVKDREGKLTIDVLANTASKECYNLSKENKSSADSDKKRAGITIFTSPQNLKQPQLVLGILLNPDMTEEQIRNNLRIIFDEWKKLRANDA